MRDARLRARRAHRGDSRRRRRRSRTGFRIPSSRLGADAPTPGREGGAPAGLRFIHIPKTGGTTIESVASDNGVDLGACVKQQRTGGDESMYYPTVGNVQCSVHHVPPAEFVPGSFCVKRNPYTRAVSQFLHVVDHPDMPKPERDAADAQYKRHSCASLARYINLRLNRVENNRLVPCLMRDAETDFASRGAAKGTAEARKNDADAREKAERKTNARADANETPERKTEAETVSAVREARLPAKRRRLSCRNANPRRRRRRVVARDPRRGSAGTRRRVFSVFFRRLLRCALARELELDGPLGGSASHRARRR